MISRWDPVVYPLSHGDGVVSMIVTISFRCERCGCYDFVMLDSAAGRDKEDRIFKVYRLQCDRCGQIETSAVISKIGGEA
jgi:hypothetical protein